MRNLSRKPEVEVFILLRNYVYGSAAIEASTP